MVDKKPNEIVAKFDAAKFDMKEMKRLIKFEPAQSIKLAEEVMKYTEDFYQSVGDQEVEKDAVRVPDVVTLMKWCAKALVYDTDKF